MRARSGVRVKEDEREAGEADEGRKSGGSICIHRIAPDRIAPGGPSAFPLR